MLISLRMYFLMTHPFFYQLYSKSSSYTHLFMPGLP